MNKKLTNLGIFTISKQVIKPKTITELNNTDYYLYVTLDSCKYNNNSHFWGRFGTTAELFGFVSKVFGNE